MAAATPSGIDEKDRRYARVTWDDLPEEMLAKRMRTLRRLLDTDDSNREKYLRVKDEMSEWDFQDLGFFAGMLNQMLPEPEVGSKQAEKI